MGRLLRPDPFNNMWISCRIVSKILPKKLAYIQAHRITCILFLHHNLSVSYFSSCTNHMFLSQEHSDRPHTIGPKITAHLRTDLRPPGFSVLAWSNLISVSKCIYIKQCIYTNSAFDFQFNKQHDVCNFNSFQTLQG